MHTAPSSQSTVTRTTPATTFKPRVRRLAPGRYLVESASRPGRGHTTTPTSCSCVGFSYRKDCKHVALVQALEPSMQQWYGQAEESPMVAVPMTAGAPSGIKRPVRGGDVSPVAAVVEQAERQLDAALRALAKTDRQADEYAVYLHKVDALERQVAAANASAMRCA